MKEREEGTSVTSAGHRWDLTPKEAMRLQSTLAQEVRIEPFAEWPETLAAVDVSIRGREAAAAIVVVSLDSGDVIAAYRHVGPVAFPYVPGLLSFREIPALMPILDRLPALPDVFMCDGQGIAHPRRFGLASHLGVWLDIPAFGVAKKKLIGSYDEPAMERGGLAPLVDKDECIGGVVRTRTGVKPVFVSAGHRINLESAIELTLSLSTRFKLPAPARMAHRLSKDGIEPTSS